MSTKLDELYFKEKSLNDELKKVQIEILKEKSLQKLDYFKENNYYEIRTPYCTSYYFHCTSKPHPNKDGIVYLHNVLEIMGTRLFYNTSLLETWCFHLDDLNKWEVLDLPKENYDQELSNLKNKASSLLGDESVSSIEECKQNIKKYERQIEALKEKMRALWIQPNCAKCIHSDSPCAPNPFDCSGFIERTKK